MNNPLKFCMVTTFYPPYSFGGDGVYIHRLSNELARRGHSVDVFHCADSYALLQKSGLNAGYSDHPNVKVTGLKSRAGFLSPLFTQQTSIPLFKRELKNRLENGRYDVIHYHNMSLIGIGALGYGSAPVKLYTMHEHWLVCPMHVLWKYDREVCSKKDCTNCQIVGKRPPQLWRHTGFLEKMLKHVDCFISPSRFTMKKHSEMGLRVPVKHIPYFLPMQQQTETTEDFQIADQNERPYFLFVGRLEKIKGVQDIIPVFKKRPEYDLLIAGDGDYSERLKKQAGGSSNIKFLGRLEQDRLKRLYEKATAVIVPSVCYETFGIIIIEAFSNKTPVIVNNLGALPEAIEDSGGGFVYNNRGELVKALKMLAGNSALRSELGNRGFEAFLKFWNEEAHLTKYFNLIEKIQKSPETVVTKTISERLLETF